MTPEEVEALTNEKLKFEAAKLLGWLPPSREIVAGQHWRSVPQDEGIYMGGIAAWENKETHERLLPDEFAKAFWWTHPELSGPIPDYPDDIAAAWELFEGVRSGRFGTQLWDFAQAVEAIIDGDPHATHKLNDEPLPALLLLGHLSPGLITRAFILAMTAEAT